MYQISPDQYYEVSGSGIKHDVGAYSLSIVGATCLASSLVSGFTFVCTGNKSYAKVAMAQAGVGIALLGAVAASEYTGTSELYGWYNTYLEVKGWKEYLIG